MYKKNLQIAASPKLKKFQNLLRMYLLRISCIICEVSNITNKCETHCVIRSEIFFNVLPVCIRNILTLFGWGEAGHGFCKSHNALVQIISLLSALFQRQSFEGVLQNR